MAIPSEGQLEAICRKDMASVNKSVSSIMDAMEAVDKALPYTWVGRDADNWRTEYNGRMGQLTALLLMALPPEEARLIEKARKKQAEMNRKRQAL
ncbi:hypothetical protein [Streptomyces natalensis]|uniref:Uncharacterized protein n=1 Tax=Streptomyces natalensis ATCC 27448 TaxID=1240678 RepID=A0A0D7CHA2_9ACTN|nr:hypothetical protein [Streptomyces natalensis]KIZ15426.1 hypothetical protein SNA_28145 [Streptomyces natalensis ATCC 27448]